MNFDTKYHHSNMEPNLNLILQCKYIYFSQPMTSYSYKDPNHYYKYIHIHTHASVHVAHVLLIHIKPLCNPSPYLL